MKKNISVVLKNLVGGVVGLLLLLVMKPVLAHPMGNFSINHYTRLTIQGNVIAGLYALDIAEIPTVSEMNRLDMNHDGNVTTAESDAYLKIMCEQLRQGLSLNVNGKPVPLAVAPGELTLRPGAGGLQTLRLTLEMSAFLSSPMFSSSVSSASGPMLSAQIKRAQNEGAKQADGNENADYQVEYKDTNYPLRTGWKEIVVIGPGNVVRDSSVSSIDVSKELTVYPSDPSIAPPQVTEAHFTVSGQGQGGQSVRQEKSIREPHSGSDTDGGRNPIAKTQNSTTPQDRFTQSIAAQGLTPALIFLSLGSAFLFGALHALSPGHGKAMVAAYLVGTRGTAWHAILLGLVVTLTHTLGVFALGIITLFASKYIVAERLYPILSGLSGLAVACMGGVLFWNRLAAWRTARNLASESDEVISTEKLTSEELTSEKLGSGEGRRPAALVAETVVETDEFLYQRRNTNSVSMRTLIGLGITGGALPCPSALVVMLSAIALHRIAFGLFLIIAFSMGLAVVLTILGLLMMHARRLLERLPSHGQWTTGLSVVSAGGVALVGVILMIRACFGSF